MNFKCNDCEVVFTVDSFTGKYTLNTEKQVCCPICQSTVSLFFKEAKK
jgi:hypothetical protein